MPDHRDRAERPKGPRLVSVTATLIAIGMICTAGCASSRDKATAIEVAKKEALSRGWAEMEVHRAWRSDGEWGQKGNWMVWLNRLPIVTGGYATIEITPQGEVIGWYRGK